MATEPLSSDPSTALEQVEKVNSTEESVSELNEKDLKAKEEEFPITSTESKEKKPTIVEELVSHVEDNDKPKADDESSSLDVDKGDDYGVLESLNEGSKVELVQSEPKIPLEPEVTEVKDMVKNEELTNEKDDETEELVKESAEAESADKFEVEESKDKESPTDEIEGIELKNESEVEPIGIESPNQENITTAEALVEEKDRDFPPEADEKIDNVVNDEYAVLETKGVDDVSETEQSFREIELPAAIDAKHDEITEKNGDVEELEKSETGTKGEESSETKAEITEDSKESVEYKATETYDADAGEDEESVYNEVGPTAAENTIQDNITTVEALVENEEKKEDVEVNEESTVHEAKKGIVEETSSFPTNHDSNNDVSKAEQTSREIELPADLEINKDGNLGTTDNGIEDEKKVDSETETKGEDFSEENARELKESEPNITEKINVEAAKDEDTPTEKVETSNKPTEQSEPDVTEGKDVEDSAEKEVKPEDLTNEKSEITEELKKESEETDSSYQIESVAAKIKESPTDKVEGFELKSEELEPISTDIIPEAAEMIDTENLATKTKYEDKKDDITANDEPALLEAKGSSDVSEAKETSRDIIDLPTDIEGYKDETLAITVDNDKNIEVEKKIDGQELLKSETGAEITEESKETVGTEATEKVNVDAAKDEESSAAENITQNNINTEEALAEHKDTEAPNSEGIAVVNDESAVPEEMSITEETYSIPTTHEVEQTSREIELPVDLEIKKDENIATTEKYAEVEKKVDVEEPEESKTDEKTSENVELDAPVEKTVEETDEVKTTEEAPKEDEAVPVKQKQSNNLLSKVKQSLVKAKKAIIKKNPSKTPPTS